MADLVITPTDVRILGRSPAKVVQFGEAVTPGQVTYLLSSDGKQYLADCDDVLKTSPSGIVLSYCGADEYGYVFDSRGTTIDLGVTLTEGVTYVISDTAGNIMPQTDLTTGQYLSILGYGSGGVLSYQPNNTQLAVA